MNAAIWNVRGLNRRDHQVAVKELISEFRLHFLGLLETRVSTINLLRIQTFLPRWSWFTDYNGPGNVVVYGASNSISRRGMWQNLGTLAQFISDEPWIVGVDFNTVLDMSEGERLSWHNCSEGDRSLWKRLDRLLVNDAWLGQWPNLHYHCLNARTSDHSPLVIRGDADAHTVSMFRFDNYLALSSKFTSSVQNKKGDLSLNVKLAAEFLGTVQNLLQSGRHNALLIQLEKCCKMVFLKATKLEQIMLQQRAKIQCLKGGDQCSRVFFQKVAMRRASKRVFQIMDEDGRTHTIQAGVINEFISFYQRLLGGNRRREFIDLRYLRPWARYVLTTEDSRVLVQSITREEIKDALFDIAEDKAPGPYGYSSGFYKAAWPVIGEELVRAPSTVSDFKPISCCNVFYKVITKIIVQRLRLVLDRLISPSQDAFVLSRSIGDNILLAQELFTGYNRQGLHMRCALKVDLRKAYDTVEWDFLIAVLQLFGFPGTFIG
ncbi:hypothetical protein Sango_3074500 [Sesamum angolense]|uniref:Reverse transcriptase domain-containing protein n=1 Tax=Sesamum angolense TaxID=2727404 RepID=A0AAE1TA51_9LAMI|nr:hypothetical protein Sango_3074500 [Sesamum angolense]